MRVALLAPVACLVLAVVAGNAVATGSGSASGEVSQVADDLTDAAYTVVADPQAAARDPQSVVDPIVNPPEDAEEPGAPVEENDPGFADRIRDAFNGKLMVAGFAGLVASMLGVGTFAMVTRYISPKEALKNPQRAMLYGFVRGNPGVHLKKLSEEFSMKTSSILWHVRKLEAAELVHSERANGFRVFYPVEGGIEIKRVSRALTALQNHNARALFETLEHRNGASPSQLSLRLNIHAGTVRWHLRKLREYGLVEELVRDDGSTFFATPLGRKALETLAGAPVNAVRVPASSVPNAFTAPPAFTPSEA